MKNYRKAQAIINNEFPDLMELKKDCEVYSIDHGVFSITNDKKFEQYWLIQKTSSEIGENYRLKFEKYLKGRNLVDIESGYIHSEDVEILGQPITIQSLLRYLGRNYCVSGDGEIIIIYPEEQIEKYVDNDYTDIKLDLSKPPQEWGEDKWGDILRLLK